MKDTTRGKAGKTGKTGKTGPAGEMSPEMIERLVRIETLCSGETEWRKHVDERFDGIGKAIIGIHVEINSIAIDHAYQKNQMERNTKRLNSLDDIDTGAVPKLQQDVRSLSTTAKTWATVASALGVMVGFVLKIFWSPHAS